MSAGRDRSPGSQNPALKPYVPAYQQVKNYVRRQIEDGVWSAGQLIPSEHELGKQFGVARMTVNRALRELVGEHLITRIQGAGTFVTDLKFESTLIEIRNIADEIKSRGDQHASKLLVLERSNDPKVLDALGLQPGEFAFHSKLVHFENTMPIQVEDRYVNPHLFPDYLEQDFLAQTPNEYMTRRAPAQRVRYWITARQATASVRKLLLMEIGEPCLVMHRHTWVREQVATYVLLWHPGSRYQLTGDF